MNRFSLVLLFGALAFSACDSADLSDSAVVASAKKGATTAPSTVETAPVSLNGVVDTPVARHMVTGRRLPGDLAASVEALGGTVSFQHPIGFAIVDGLSDADAVELAAVRGIDAIEADFTFEREPDAQLEAVEASLDSPADAVFYQRGYQWHMDAIGAPTAWAAGRTGSSDVTVAIIDSGLDPTHADLAGLVDEENSISFLEDPFEDLIRNAYFPGAPDWTDLNSHGTHVGATVASNGIVGAGVTENVTLMAVKVCRYSNSCSGAAIIAGILHAADKGADVANMSLGGNFSKGDIARAGFAGYVGFLNKTFTYASRQGMTIVVSAGNESIDLDHDGDAYKTYCSTPGTVCVSATGPQATDDIRVGPFYDIKAPASYTNYGRSAVDLAAPGGDSNGFVWAACSSTRVQVQDGFIVRSVCTQSKGYITGKAGTSMAAPHVSGLAALLVEDYGRSPSRIQNRMAQTAEDLGQRGVDPFYGKGYIDVPAALGLGVDA